MRNVDSFSACHPGVNFLYYALVLVFSMCLMHPAYLAISLLSAVAYSIRLRGRRAVRSAVFLLPMLCAAAFVNPAFNHEGATILTYLPSGNPLTLESIYYGVAAAAMLGGVVMWFTSFNEVMTSDKFVYLFGRVIPALSLVLSMTLRFVPRFMAQFRRVSRAQKCIGRDSASGNVIKRMRCAAAMISTMITWSLENALDTADSMRARGYGLPHRTSFSIYRFTERDRMVLLWLLGCGGFVAAGWIAGGTFFRYYPTVKAAPLNVWTVLFAAVYAALCLTPLILDWKEELTWKAIRSAA